MRCWKERNMNICFWTASTWGQFTKIIAFVIKMLTFCIALTFLVAAIIDYGFKLYPHEQAIVEQIYHCAWIYYLIIFTSRLIFKWRSINRKTALLTIIMGILLYSSMLAHFIAPTDNTSILWVALKSKYYQLFILSLFSIIEASKGIVSLIGKKTNPALLLAQGFLLIIFIGTILLLLPNSTAEHIHLSVVDALFVSTSAVCVTGLTPVDVSSVFTMNGQLIIAMLIQIGGLGVMTITSFLPCFLWDRPDFIASLL